MPTITPSTPPAADEAEIERPKPAAAGKPSPDWPTARKIGTGFAAVGAAIGVLVAVAGLALIGLHGFARDADGYYDPGSETLQSDRFAISAEHLDLGADPAARRRPTRSVISGSRPRARTARRCSSASRRSTRSTATCAASGTPSSPTSTAVIPSTSSGLEMNAPSRLAPSASGPPRAKARASNGSIGTQPMASGLRSL